MEVVEAIARAGSWQQFILLFFASSVVWFPLLVKWWDKQI